MADIMTATQRGERTYMIDIDLTAMAGHRLGHFPDISPSCPEEVIPEPHGGCQFGVIPCIASYIVPPTVPLRIVGMHDVTIVPEAIPLMLLYSPLIEVGEECQPPLGGILPVFGQRPDAEGPFLIEVFWCRQKLGICHQPLCIMSHLRLSLISRLRQ